jgi:hypothetical protein
MMPVLPQPEAVGQQLIYFLLQSRNAFGDRPPFGF